VPAPIFKLQMQQQEAGSGATARHRFCLPHLRHTVFLFLHVAGAYINMAKLQMQQQEVNINSVLPLLMSVTLSMRAAGAYTNLVKLQMQQQEADVGQQAEVEEVLAADGKPVSRHSIDRVVSRCAVVVLLLL
jgi:hypothetical protein